MEQDKQLKEILLNSAEGASDDFTDAVMKKVYSLSAAPSYYQPLVSPKLKNRFVFAFGVIVAAILTLCLFIALAGFNIVGWIQSTPLPDLNYTRILIFILIFWFLFTLNIMFEKDVQLHRDWFAFKHHD